MALLVHLLALTSAFVPVPVAQPPVEYYAYEPAPFLGRSDVVMSTKYQAGVFAAIGRKKDPTSTILGRNTVNKREMYTRVHWSFRIRG